MASLAMVARNLNTDQFALLQFKDQILDPHNVLTNNWTSSSYVCQWVGVSCGVKHERVTSLTLSHMNLTGTIPPHLGSLSFLLHLDMSSNNFYGHLPRELGQLRRLRFMQLSFNHVNGNIPQSLVNMSNLEMLDLGFNQLSGQIPSSIFKVSSLKGIHLDGNSFSGSLPDDFCVYLPGLEELNLYGIQHLALEVEIPEEIGNLFHLEILSAANMSLTGQIPASIFNISSLNVVDFSLNSVSGNLPPFINVPKLERFSVWENNLSGNIPNSISNASMLKFIELSVNYFSGLIPNTLGSLRHLERLGLAVSDNALNGILPTYFGNLSTSLQRFYASACELGGYIPLEVGNLSNMLLLELRNNKIIGSIPTTIRGLRNIQALSLGDNELHGNICSLERLYQLGLNFNKLCGPIPTCLGNLTSLRYLYLESNKLSSSIPSTLWSLKDILEMDLSSNYLSVSYPLDVGNLRALRYLNLSGNLLMSDILSTIGGLETLVSLDLSFNKFRGYIPESIGKLISQVFLDLSNNYLFGLIPKSLENLSNLDYFNVSFNRLEGEIPTGGCFRNFSSRSFLKNDALCGPPRLLVPPCKSSIHRNSNMNTRLRLLRYGLPVIASLIIIALLFCLYKKSKNRSKNIQAVKEKLDLKTWRIISHAELLQATYGFGERNMLGSSSFGSVYKGRLLDGTNVAIKVFNLQLEGAFRSFDIECEMLSKILHRNVVKIITCCSNVDFKALVLDFMPNGSLEKWLYSQDHFLHILQRIDIMIGVASALEYLHLGHPAPIVHCVKPSNILLDEDIIAHVGDFGIAKLLGEGDLMIQTMTLATIGYMAPEFGSAGIVSITCDVYSYGILLFETFTRKKPTDGLFNEAMTIRHWVRSLLSKGMIDIAEERKDMKDVVATLKKIKQSFLNKIEHV
ncbi:hypothetical protein PTKIN_Ptkin14bG0160700 [Pterospermum kingtungense]